MLVGLLSWTAFWWIGLDNASAWAVVAGLLHIVPYPGPAITAGAHDDQVVSRHVEQLHPVADLLGND